MSSGKTCEFEHINFIHVLLDLCQHIHFPLKNYQCYHVFNLSFKLVHFLHDKLFIIKDAFFYGGNFQIFVIKFQGLILPI